MKKFDPIHAAENGYTREDWDAVDSPELTCEDIARAQPMSVAMPDLYQKIMAAKRRRGPARSKIQTSIRLSPNVLMYFKAQGPGWQGRIDDALKAVVDAEEHLEDHDPNQAGHTAPHAGGRHINR